MHVSIFSITICRPNLPKQTQCTIRGIAVMGLLIHFASVASAIPLKKNPVVGTFTVTPLSNALLAENGLIESGAAFLYADGTAVGFDQIVIAPQNQVAPGEVDDFLNQGGVLPFASDITVEFSSWELQDNDTVTISGITSGTSTAGADLLAAFGLPNPYVGPILSGFIFSAEPVGRDLIGNDGVEDHIEYIATQPDETLVGDAADFLVSHGLLSKGEAQVIQVSLRDHPRVSAVPEPTSPLLLLTGVLAALSTRRRLHSVSQ